jgi:anti-anti-sigma factor
VNRRRRTEPVPEACPLVLRLFGACDATTQTGLRMQLRRAGASAEGRQLVVDLTDVPFMDATGLASLIEVQALISSGLTIRNPPWSLTRILVALNLTGLFNIEETRLSESRLTGHKTA